MIINNIIFRYNVDVDSGKNKLERRSPAMARKPPEDLLWLGDF